jgi:PAS domain S-box-containing protein
MAATDPPFAANGDPGSSLRVEDRAWFQEVGRTRRPVTDGRVVTGRLTGAAVISVHAPILDRSGRLAGVVSGGLGLAHLQALADRVKLGRTGYAQLTSPDGIVLAHPDRDVVARRHDLSGTPVWQAVGSTRAGRVPEYLAGPDDRRLAAYATIPGLGWRVWVTQSLAEVEGQVVAAYGSMLGWALAALAGAAATVVALATVVARPIRALSRSARALGGGDFAQRAVEQGPREVVELAQAFNQMAGALARHEREVTETTTLLNSVLESATEYPIVATGLDRTILSWNEGAQRIYGHEATAVLGRTAVTFEAGDVEAGRAADILAAARAEGTWEGEIRQVRADGTGFPAHLTVTRREDGAGAPIGFTFISRDQARINAGLAQRCAAQSAAISVLSTLSNALTKSFDTPLPADEMLAACMEAGSFSLAALYLLDPGGRLALAGHRGYTDTPLAEVETLFGHEPLFRSALETASPIAVPSPAIDASVAAEFLSRTGPASALVLPILFGDERLGVLLVGTNLTDLSADESLDLARTIGHQIGLVIQLRRAFTRVAAAEQQYREVFEHALEGILRSTPDGRLILANPAMARIFGYDSPVHMLAAVSDIGHQLHVDPADRAVLLRILDVQGSVHRFECQMRRRDGAVIWVSQSAQTIRDGAGQVLYYEGMLEDITERKRAEAVATALASTASGLLGSLDPGVLGRLVARNVCGLLNATVALVYRIEPESGDLVAMAASGDELGTNAWATRLPAGTGLTRLAVRERRPQTAPDILLDPRADLPAERHDVLATLADRAVLVVPLVVRDRVFGTLIVRDLTGRRFEPAEVELAQAFADQAAIALDNARLFEEARAGRDFLASITENSADGILTTDATGRITYFSHGAGEIWGRTEADVQGRPLSELMSTTRPRWPTCSPTCWSATGTGRRSSTAAARPSPG